MGLNQTSFKKGRPWNKGTLGWHPTIKTKLKMRLAKFGKKLIRSEEGKKSFREKMSGKNNHNWNGGTSKGYRKGYRDNLAYKEWRIAVFERDDYTCQVCGITGVYITSHHVKSWAKYPELRHEVSNGVTLCEICHSKTDNYKGRGNKRWAF